MGERARGGATLMSWSLLQGEVSADPTDLGGGNSNISYFHLKIGEAEPILTKYFSNGFKPTTRWMFFDLLICTMVNPPFVTTIWQNFLPCKSVMVMIYFLIGERLISS